MARASFQTRRCSRNSHSIHTGRHALRFLRQASGGGARRNQAGRRGAADRRNGGTARLGHRFRPISSGRIFQRSEARRTHGSYFCVRTPGRKPARRPLPVAARCRRRQADGADAFRPDSGSIHATLRRDARVQRRHRRVFSNRHLWFIHSRLLRRRPVFHDPSPLGPLAAASVVGIVHCVLARPATAQLLAPSLDGI